MTLKALIVRCDGILADTDELARAALNQMLADAGFAWRCDRAAFALAQRAGSPLERMVKYIIPKLGYQRASADVEHLAAAMVRRQASIFSEMLAKSALKPRPGMIDLVMAAKADELKLALVSALPLRDVERIVSSTLGSGGLNRFDVVAAGQGANPSGDGEPKPPAHYQDALQKLAIPSRQCLAIECSAAGVAAAGAAGVKAIALRKASLPEERFDQAALVADDVPALIGVAANMRLDPLNAQQRAQLTNVLQSVHASDGAASVSQEKKKMTVASILRTKGSAVKTILADASVRELSERLSSDAVGAMVVLSSSGRLAGIISERDIARGLAEHGAALPSLALSRLMTKAVVTCSPDDSIANISKIMTQKRIRHLPVVKSDELVGLVSIGDVLKSRLDEIQLEANVLRDFALAKI